MEERIILKPAKKITIKLTDSELLKLISLCEIFGIDYKYSPKNT